LQTEFLTGISKEKRMQKYVLVILFLVAPALSMAQGYGSGRSKTWDFSVGGIYQMENSAQGQGGSSLEVDNAYGLGFNLGYNITSHFNINFDFEFLRPDYKATVIEEAFPPDGNPGTTETIRHEMQQFNGRLKATYYFLDGPFVPYIEAGIGWTWLDSNVANGPPQNFCWWHPWYGYVCDSYVDTFDETEASYGGAVGMRFELANRSFVKASYNLWELDTSSDRAAPQLESFRIEYGWRF